MVRCQASAPLVAACQLNVKLVTRLTYFRSAALTNEELCRGRTIRPSKWQPDRLSVSPSTSRPRAIGTAKELLRTACHLQPYGRCASKHRNIRRENVLRVRAPKRAGSGERSLFAVLWPAYISSADGTHKVISKGFDTACASLRSRASKTQPARGSTGTPCHSSLKPTAGSPNGKAPVS